MAGSAPDVSLQGIEANYYNITNNEGMPIAGLLVLLDRLHRPVRAELHLYDDLSEEGREVAVSQGRMILQDRYYSRSAVPMRILHTFPERNAVNVRLPETKPATGTQSSSGGGFNWRMLAAVLGALALVALLVWGITQLLGNRGNESGAEQTPATVTAAPAAADDAAPAQAGTPNELPPSRNARSDIQVGSSIQIVPGYQLTLRSEAGPDAGQEVGYMVDGQRATVIDGPILTQGNSDTIVWWRVRLEDGTEAWAAANTSDVTLLIPATE